MNKQKKLQRELEKYLAKVGVDSTEIKEKLDMENLYTEEDNMYEGQAILNFFTYRVKPILDGKKPGEKEARFKQRQEEWEKLYHQWKIRECETCHNTFAYALNYEGVKFCSLLCLDKALEEVGLKVTRGRDIRLRWGVQQHPAIVPSSAFETLKTSHPDAQIAFSPSQ